MAICIDCSKDFEREKKRGRPFLKCPECKAIPVIPVRRKAAQQVSLESPVVWVAFYQRMTTTDEVIIGVYAYESEAQQAADRVADNYKWRTFVQEFTMSQSYIGME